MGRKLSALRHLYRYLLLDKKIEHDPTLNIESPRQWKVLPKSLARDEVESTLAFPAAQLASGRRTSKDATALAARDRAMLELLYAGALRVSELVKDVYKRQGIHVAGRSPSEVDSAVCEQERCAGILLQGIEAVSYTHLYAECA